MLREREPRGRRRLVKSYGLSILLHGAVFVLLFAHVVDIGGTTPEDIADLGEVTMIRHESPLPAAQVTRPPSVPTAQAVAPTRSVPRAPRSRPLAVPPPRVVPTPAPRPHELRHIVHRAIANPTLPPTSTPSTSPTVLPTTLVSLVTSPPTSVPTAAPTIAATAAPTIAPILVATAAPTVAPTRAPTAAPTAAPTIAPTREPTAAPTAAPTIAPTHEPTAAPTIAATHAPTAAPTHAPAAPTSAPTAAPTTAASAAPTSAPTRAASIAARATPTAGPSSAAASGTGARSPEPVRSTAPAVAIAHAVASPAPQHSATRNDDSLNERLRTLIPHGSVDYGPKHVAVDANDVRDHVQAAYEKALAPPPDILAETFGILYQKRTLTAPDSIAYIFEKFKIGPFTACKAYKIVEHPLSQSSGILTVSNGQGGIGGSPAAVEAPGPPRGDPPDVGIVTIVPCNDASYMHVEPGSITTPLPRHPPNH